jgi:hypothetical protein
VEAEGEATACGSGLRWDPASPHPLIKTAAEIRAAMATIPARFTALVAAIRSWVLPAVLAAILTCRGNLPRLPDNVKRLTTKRRNQRWQIR